MSRSSWLREWWPFLAFIVAVIIYVGFMIKIVVDANAARDQLFATCIERGNDPIWCREVAQ